MFAPIRFLLFALVLVSVTGCVSNWEVTRTDVVEPIQQLLHRDYPTALASRSPSKLTGWYVAPELAVSSASLWESFSIVERATAVIVDAEHDGDLVRASVEVRLEGRARGGVPVMVEQTRTMTCLREGEAWRISDDQPDAAPTTISAPAITYVDEAEVRGVPFRHTAAALPDPRGEPQPFVLGAGVGAGDLDGDGWEELVFVGSNRLTVYRNRGGDDPAAAATFDDVTVEWGLDLSYDKGAPTCVVVWDYDRDGDRDLFVGAHLTAPRLWRNDFEATPDHRGFTLVEESGLICPSGRTVTATAADFDGDGWLDLFVGNNEDVFHRAPSPLGVARNAHPDQLFLNRRDGTFLDVTEGAGVGNTGWSLVSTAVDCDGDGDVDLFVGNDFGLDVLYRNDGPGAGSPVRFTDVTDECGLDEPIASMSADWGDFDGDGDFDLFVGGMASSTGWVIDHPEFPSPVNWLLDTVFRPYVRERIRAFFHGNRFYENLGDGTFRDVSKEAGVHYGQWAWGSCWLDTDNDGHLDIYQTNGFISGPEKDDL